MATRFSGAAVLVTGGGSGIGRAIALAFAREGASVTVVGRRPRPLEDTVALIEGEGLRGVAATADVTIGEEVARAVAGAASPAGRLDVAVNAAGVGAAGTKIADLDEETWSRVLTANLTGIWMSMKHEIAYMRDHGGGAIVNLASSVGAHVRYPGLGAYAASKAAVSALTRTAAREYIGDGIRINAVSPGPTDTPMSLRPGETETDRAARLKTTLPIGRVGALEEVASAVLWVASSEAGFTVGHDLVVDGGATA
jgi:NAD(P)-dependent dehydrogenase (short-subunit alcohol dehydrogenase family)